MDEQKTTDWTNYGDVNFLKYGGMLIRQDPVYEDTTHEVILAYSDWDDADIPEGMVKAWHLSVDPSADWIDWDDIARMGGTEPPTTEKDAVCAVVQYYGLAEFQPIPLGDDDTPLCSVERFAEILKEYGADEVVGN